MNNQCDCGCHTSATACHCGQHDEIEQMAQPVADTPATPEQLDFLRSFAQIAPLPIVKYLVKSSAEHSFETVALADVCLRSGEDSIACIKETAAFLQGLQTSNLIVIDYDTVLEDTAYQHYFQADSYLLLEDTVKQGKEKAGFLGDYVTIEKGCICMTTWGKEQL